VIQATKSRAVEQGARGACTRTGLAVSAYLDRSHYATGTSPDQEQVHRFCIKTTFDSAHLETIRSLRCESIIASALSLAKAKSGKNLGIGALYFIGLHATCRLLHDPQQGVDIVLRGSVVKNASSQHKTAGQCGICEERGYRQIVRAPRLLCSGRRALPHPPRAPAVGTGSKRSKACLSSVVRSPVSLQFFAQDSARVQSSTPASRSIIAACRYNGR
jgi:hypothetical protein